MNIVEVKNLDKVTEGRLLIVWENSVRATHHFYQTKRVMI